MAMYHQTACIRTTSIGLASRRLADRGQLLKYVIDQNPEFIVSSDGEDSLGSVLFAVQADQIQNERQAGNQEELQ